MRRKPKPSKRKGVLARIMDRWDSSNNDQQSFRTRRQAYVWLQKKLEGLRRPLGVEGRLYQLVDTIKPNYGSFKARRVLD